VRVREPFERSPERQEQRRRAVRLEWWTLFWMATVVAVVGVTMGSSQAMKAAWVEDLLSLVPPIAFLVASRVHDRPANQRYPYGYRRAFSISFLIAAAALFGFGAFILLDSVLALVHREHPTIGLVRLFGVEMWSGWPMIAALAYSAVPPVVLGRRKQPLARRLHDKTLHADAAMNRADWMTAGAGIVGILGIAIGWWWADSVAAGLISLAIVKDGVENLRHVIGDLMDRRPVTVDRAEPDGIVDNVRTAVEALPWVAGAEVRLREEGEVLNGELFVVPRDARDLVARLAEAEDAAGEADQRVYDVVATAVERLQGGGAGEG
jgi:cation diffusion facilitator family transporter